MLLVVSFSAIGDDLKIMAKSNNKCKIAAILEFVNLLSICWRWLWLQLSYCSAFTKTTSFPLEKEKKCWNNSDIFLAECNNLMIVSGWHVQICSDIVFLLSGNVQLPIHQIQGHNAFGVLHRMSNLGMKLPKQDLEENLGSSFFRNLSNTKLAYLEHRAHLLFCPSNHSKAKRSTTGDYNHVVPTNLLSIKE